MALVNKYCNPTGAGAHDGSTPADAWSFTEALAGAAAGQIVNTLAGSGNTYDGTTAIRTFATVGTTVAPVWWRGYKTTPGDQDGNNLAVAGVDIPTLTTTTGNYSATGTYQIWSNIDFTGAPTANRLFNSTAAQSIVYGCRFRTTGGSVPTSLFQGSDLVARCYFSSTVSQILLHGLTGGQLLILGNYFTGGSGGVIFTTGIANTIQANVFDAIGGDAMSFTTGYGNVLGNSVYAPLGHGLTWSSTPSGGCHVANNHFENVNQASKAAINNGSGTASGLIRPVGNSYYQCTSNVAGQGDNPNIFDVGTLAGSGFVNAAGHDFTPSALLLAKGFPGQFENISAFRGYMNPGALQSQASSGGGGGYLVGGGLVR